MKPRFLRSLHHKLKGVPPRTDARLEHKLDIILESDKDNVRLYPPKDPDIFLL